jgi:hypothetical protein
MYMYDTVSYINDPSNGFATTLIGCGPILQALSPHAHPLSDHHAWPWHPVPGPAAPVP